MRIGACLAVLLLAAAAWAEDVRIQVAKGLAVEEFLGQIHGVTGEAALFPPADVEGRTIPGRFDFEVARDHLHDALVFVLKTCDLELRRYGGAAPLAVVLPSKALTNRFRLTGGGDVEFDRPPAAWAGRGDIAGSLAGPSVTALLADLRGGDAARRRAAALLLGYAAPRTPQVVAALAAALAADDAALAARAAWALGECGYFAKAALPALREAGDTEAVREAIARIDEALHPGLLEPARARETAPGLFSVRLETTRGAIVIEVRRDWAPRGADRFYNLVKIGFFDGLAMFRVIPGFVAQFGKHNDPRVNAAWHTATIRDDPVRQRNARGTVTYAQAEAAHSRSTQLFINLTDNTFLDRKRFAPLGKVVEGMDVADKLFGGYGDSVNQGRLHFEGDKYLRKNFPKLDRIKTARIVE